MPCLHSEPLDAPLSSVLARPEPGIALYWLGQAGFALRHRDLVVLIDPYLSDALARKYAGTPLSHTRMMAAPIEAEQLPRIDAVLITHRHGDHLDLPTLAVIARNSPACHFVLPAAELQRLAELGMDAERLVGLDAGQRWTHGALTVAAIPAAHETRDRDAAGHHHYLGYVIGFGDATLYHSGDCVPFAGLDAALSPHAIDVAMLPVNGRDGYRAGMGIPGNFTLDEAIALCRRHDIPEMLAHHFGMFAFNSIEPRLIDSAARRARSPAIHAAAPRTRYMLATGATPAPASMRAGTTV